MLRRSPVELYSPFSQGGNTFSTSIHVLVSAVQKIARVTKIPNGLLLYRGLGATELPAHFSRQEPKTGCRGFVEWGFMSTTSNKAVAVQYTGIKQGKPLAMLFEIQVALPDRAHARVHARAHEHVIEGSGRWLAYTNTCAGTFTYKYR